MIIDYYDGVLSSYLGLPFLEFIALGICVLIALVIINMNRGDR